MNDATLFVWLAQKPKYFNILDEYVVEIPELFHDTPDSAEDFDSPICLAYTMAKSFNVYYCQKLVSHQYDASEDS